jgi:hypothetical protein
MCDGVKRREDVVRNAIHVFQSINLIRAHEAQSHRLGRSPLSPLAPDAQLQRHEAE